MEAKDSQGFAVPMDTAHTEAKRFRALIRSELVKTTPDAFGFAASTSKVMLERLDSVGASANVKRAVSAINHKAAVWFVCLVSALALPHEGKIVDGDDAKEAYRTAIAMCRELIQEKEIASHIYQPMDLDFLRFEAIAGQIDKELARQVVINALAALRYHRFLVGLVWMRVEHDAQGTRPDGSFDVDLVMLNAMKDASKAVFH